MSSCTLSSEQAAVLQYVTAGQNIFFTGCAGSGKSYVLKEIIRQSPPECTFVTALTGIAAQAIGGTTLHSFAGIGLGTKPVEELVQMVLSSRKSCSNWRVAKVLIVDEISMLSADLFDALEYIARRVRDTEEAFGGIQLILTGDFFQLPPVGSSIKYCFEATAWKRCVKRSLQLTKIYRQSEAELISLLQDVRYNKLTDQSLKTLERLNHSVLTAPDGIIPTKLYATNENVDKENSKHLAMLSGDLVQFRATDEGVDMDRFCLAPKVLELKIGAQVMILKNINEKIVNGSRGVVTDFDLGFPVVKFLEGSERRILTEEWCIDDKSGRKLGSRRQLPLKLAWAVTIHKSQGMTIDYLEVKLDDVFTAGQAYVALSRARTLSGLKVSGFNVHRFSTSDNVVTFYESLMRDQSSENPIGLDKPSGDLWSKTTTSNGCSSWKTPSKKRKDFKAQFDVLRTVSRPSSKQRQEALSEENHYRAATVSLMPAEVMKRKVCKQFRWGWCNLGKKCRDLHSKENALE